MASDVVIDFKAPNYVPEYARRARMLTALRARPDSIPAVMAHYSRSPVDYIEDWMMTYDPRVFPQFRPFLLWPRQKEYIAWLVKHWKERQSGLVEKSRDAGASWLNCAFAIWLWAFHGAKVGFGSRKEVLVDKMGDPDSLFEKLRMLLKNMPSEVLPNGFNMKVHCGYMKVMHPTTPAAITGEAGDNIGRGGRSTVYFKDEALTLTSKLMTRDGEMLMRDVYVGARIYGPDGKLCKVIGINKCGKFPIIRLHFSDGTFVRCSPRHKWRVDKVIGKRERIVRTAEQLSRDFEYTSPGGQKQFRYRVPLTQAVDFGERDALLIDPYVMGCLLGDGSFAPGQTSVTFTSADPQIVEEISRRLPPALTVKQTGDIQYAIVSGTGKGKGLRGKKHPLRAPLRAMGLLGKRAWEKHVPSEYQFASAEERLELIKGLMDTVGSTDLPGRADLHTSSHELATDVAQIVRSLGGSAKVLPAPSNEGHRMMYCVRIVLPGVCPFRLDRKVRAYRTRKHPPQKTIVSVEHEGVEEEVQCITVDREDGLFLTDNFTVTHNSAFYERPLLIEASLSQNTEVQIDVSTPHGPGNIFYKKRHSGKIDVFIFDWKDDPRKDDAWYAKQKDELDPVIVAQEIDRDYGASMENMLIPKKYVDAAVGFLLPQDPSLADMEEVAGLDVADEGGDENVLIFRRGPQVLDIDAWRKGNVAQSTKKAVARMRLRRIARLQYDNIGVGAGVKGELSNEGYEEVEAYGINTGESPTGGMTDNRPNSKMFFNLKAQLWWQLRRRFERTYFHREGMREYPAADMISIPDDPILRTELSTPKYEYKGAGLIAVESKEKLARRGVGSPNRADALCLTFAPAIRKVATTFRKRKNT